MASQRANETQCIGQSDIVSISRRSSHSDVFSDSNAINPFEVSPLPSPTDNEDRHVEAGFHNSSHVRRPPSLHQPFPSRLGDLHRNSSIQRYLGRQPSTSRRDASMTTDAQTHNSISEHNNPIADAAPHRGTSIASRMTTSRIESPYQGTSGPSHPYAMYSQDIGVGRTLSNATSSTFRSVPRSYSGPSRPTHPYAMYPQDTSSEDDVSMPATVSPLVPPGSATRDQRYERRLGPEGEDVGDIVGPDGHTEQLPPYTRYANDLPPKESPVETNSPDNPLHNPFGDSQTALNGSPVEPTQNQITPTPLSHFVPGMEALQNRPPAGEGGHFKEFLTAKSRRRICGLVPLWLVIILIVLLLTVIIGGAVGAVLHHAHHTEAETPLPSVTSAAPTVTVTSLIDAAMITNTPTNLPPLPMGNFFIPLQNSSGLSTSNDSCLTDSSQRNTWACVNGASINLELSPASGNSPQASLAPSKLFNVPPIMYGAQPPQLNHSANLLLMSDKEDTVRGPAYFFQELYDKIVVVRESDFNQGDMKRWLYGGPDGSYDGTERKDIDQWGNYANPVAVAADRPWFCFWNSTVMEGFIYVTEDANGSTSTGSDIQSIGAAISSHIGAASSQGSAASSILTSSLPSSVEYPPVAAYTAPPSLKNRQATAIPLPKVIKLEERRGPRRVNPYCQQMQIMNDGTASPITIAPSGQLNIVDLTEEEPAQQKGLAGPNQSPSQQNRRSYSGNRHPDRDNFLASACQCQWLND